MLDWTTFSVRLRPTKSNLRTLTSHLATLNHAALLRGVRAAKHALTYHLDGYTGRECASPLLARLTPRPLPLTNPHLTNLT